MIFHIYIGPPGCGKTFLASKHLEEFGGYLIDDIKSMSEIDLAVSLERDNIFITDPHLCLVDNRFLLKDKILSLDSSAIIKWFFFENNIYKCWKNIQHRNDNRNMSIESVKYFSKIYTVPSSHPIIEIQNVN